MGSNMGRMHSKYKRKLPALSFGIYGVMLVVLSIGVIFGSFAANNMEAGMFADISENIQRGFSHMASGASSDVFRESMFKYSRTIVIVWLLNFIWAGFFAQLAIIAFKGFSMGYMVSIFVMEFGKKGLLISAAGFLIQSMAIVLMLIFIAQPEPDGATARILKKKSRLSKKEQPPMGLLEKLIILLICLSLTMVIALYEAYICPGICLRLLYG